MARVVIVVFEAAQALDFVGPATVFAAARTQARAGYEVSYASMGGGPCRVTSGLVLDTVDLARVRVRATDTILVPGGEEPAMRKALADDGLLLWLRRAAARAKRVASVCSGAFLLAEAGLLDGKRCTTHWRACDRLAHAYPKLKVDGNAIYVQSGGVWTSAGVTTGIDMALGLVELDCGRPEVDRLARDLIMYVRRPGFQSQFSALLVAQTASSAPLWRGLEWARANLPQATVESLAQHAGLSVRTLHRVCREQHRTTPGKLLDRIRVERARVVLSTTGESLKSVAAGCGFDSSLRMRRAFLRELGMGPHEYRHLHGARDLAQNVDGLT